MTAVTLVFVEFTPGAAQSTPWQLGDAVRAALGPGADDLESVSVLATTDHDDLPEHARDRLGIRPGQVNVVVRLVLRPLGATLTDEQANRIRDRVYAAVHRGHRWEWAAR